MKLIVQELKGNPLIQEMTASKNAFIEAIVPHLIRSNFPDGALKMQVLDSDDNILANSETINIDDIGSADYLHGYIPFSINVGVKAGETYKFKLITLGGYSYSDTVYVGWCNGFDLSKYSKAYIINSNIEQPFDLEIWERKSV